MDELIELLKEQQETYFEMAETWATTTGNPIMTGPELAAAIYTLCGQDVVALIAFAEAAKLSEEAYLD